MKVTSRRAFLTAASAAAIGTLVPKSARAAPLVYKLGHAAPLTFTAHLQAVEAAKEVERRTAGALKIEVFGASALGGDTSLLSQVRQGSLEFYIGGASVLASVVPLTAIWSMGFAFSSYADVWRAVDGELGTLVRNAISKTSGLTVFDTAWDLGFRQISTSGRPVQKVGDLSGVKMRVPVSPVLTSMFTALRAAPISLNFGEVYAALQTRLADGQESTLTIFEAAKLYEVQKYVSLSSHSWEGTMILSNTAAWNRLPADMRNIVSRVFNAQGLIQRQRSEDLVNSLRASLGEKGVAFVEPDRNGFKELLRSAGFYKEWRERMGQPAWSVLGRYAPDIA
jgi:tripartite ATP-independent transporter DctP family solute receptor